MNYRISIHSSGKQELKIQFSYTQSKKKEKIILPIWRPGRYELANYYKNYSSLELATKGELNKLDHHRYEVIADRGNEVVLIYKYFCTEMDAGNSYLSPTDCVLNPINFCVYVEGRQDESLMLEIHDDFPREMVSQLTFDENRRVSVPNYGYLMDSPIFISNSFEIVRDDMEHASIQYVFMNLKEDVSIGWIEGMRKVIMQQFELFGGSPTTEYKFMIYSPDQPFYHGVEHKDSTVIVLGPAGQLFEKNTESLYGISSHEFFHLWNACRIKPAAFLPNYSVDKLLRFDSGWMLEGITTLYGDLMLARAGVYSFDWFMIQVKRWLYRHLVNPVRDKMNILESSKSLWETGYDKVNAPKQLSIYSDGALIILTGHLLLLKNGIDDGFDVIVRQLWEEFGNEESGYDATTVSNFMMKLIPQTEAQIFERVLHQPEELLIQIKKIFSDFGVNFKTGTTTEILSWTSLDDFQFEWDNVTTENCFRILGVK